MSNRETWKKDFKAYVESLSLSRDDYKGIMEYIDEFPDDHNADSDKMADGDCISRQMAIDAVSEYATIWMSYTDDMSASDIAQEAINSAKDTMIRILKEQPTIQPEIIRCKDCKHMIDTGDDLMCDNAKGWVVATASDFGCVLAERRTDEQAKKGCHYRNIQRIGSDC